MTLFAETHAVPLFAAQRRVIGEGCLVVNVNATAVLLKHFPASLASVFVALATGARPFLASMLLPSPSLIGCIAAPVVAVLACTVFLLPSPVTLVATEVVPASQTWPSRQLQATPFTLAFDQAAAPIGAIRAAPMLAMPCAITSMVAEMTLVPGYMIRFPHQRCATLGACTGHQASIPAWVSAAGSFLAKAGSGTRIATEDVPAGLI